MDVKIKINLSELQELLNTATDQVKSLSDTIKAINNFELKFEKDTEES